MRQCRVRGEREAAQYGTGIEPQTTTSETGGYLFLNVKIGKYRVSIEKTGFTSASAENVMVTVNARQRVDVDLKVGQATESIQMNDGVIAVEADSSDLGLVVNRRQIVELPLNGRNYSDLALLSTGVRRSHYAFANRPREGSLNVNGQRSIFKNFLMDGLDNNAYGTSNQGFSNQVNQLAPDAVGEFKVVTSNASAEYGRSSGAVINAAMKSGTNELHGTADWRNSTWAFRSRSGFRHAREWRCSSGPRHPIYSIARTSATRRSIVQPRASDRFAPPSRRGRCSSPCAFRSKLRR